MRCFLFTLTFIVQALMANEDLVSPGSDVNLDFEVRYFNAVTKAAVNLEHHFDKYPMEDPDKVLKRDVFINKLMQKELYHLADMYLEQYSLPPSAKSAFMQKLKAFHWDKILKQSYETLTKRWSKRNYYVKKYGYSKLIILGMGLALDVVIPMALVSMNYAILIPVSVYTPYIMLPMGIANQYEKAKLKRRVKKSLGLHYFDYIKVKKEIDAKIKSVHAKDLLFPVSPKGIQAENIITIHSSGLMSRFLSVAKLDKHLCNYHTILSFIKKEGFQDDYILWIKKQKHLSQEVRALLMVQHTFEHGSNELQANFIAKFSRFFTKRPKLPHIHKLKRWTHHIMSAQNAQDISKAMIHIPPQIPPILIVQLWEELIIHKLIEHVPMKRGALASLQRELHVLKAIASTKDHGTTWNKAFARLFKQKISHIIPDLKVPCQKANKDLFNQLLNKY